MLTDALAQRLGMHPEMAAMCAIGRSFSSAKQDAALSELGLSSERPIHSGAPDVTVASGSALGPHLRRRSRPTQTATRKRNRLPGFRPRATWLARPTRAAPSTASTTP